MGLLQTFDGETPEILKPSAFTPYDPSFPEMVLVMFRRKTLDCLLEQVDAEVVCHVNAGVLLPVYRFAYRGKPMAAYLTVLGGPATVGLLEEIIARGARKIVLFGSCGVLDGSMAAGHLIVPTAAYRDEGTSYHYAPAGDWMDVPTAPELCRIFDALHLPYVCGKTWTTDAFYRETQRNMAARKQDGCITVEMECASVMAMSQFRGVDAYQFLYAEDSLDGAEWDARTMGCVPQSATERYVRIALETAVRV